MPVDPNRDFWKPGMSWEKALEDVAYIRELASEMGGKDRVERQHSAGRGTVRQRLEQFCDAG